MNVNEGGRIQTITESTCIRKEGREMRKEKIKIKTWKIRKKLELLFKFDAIQTIKTRSSTGAKE